MGTTAHGSATSGAATSDAATSSPPPTLLPSPTPSATPLASADPMTMLDTWGYDCCCRVEAHKRHVNYCEPWVGGNVSKAIGSGFFVGTKPHMNGNNYVRLVCTAAHVVADSTSVEIKVPSLGIRTTYGKCSIFSFCPDQDIALLAVEVPKSMYLQGGAAPTKPLPLGNHHRCKPGSKLVALGFPLGSLSLSVTTGDYVALAPSGLIQTSAAVNPGNSGGPLIDFKTRKIIGCVSSKMVGVGMSNVAFAVSTNLIKEPYYGGVMLKGKQVVPRALFGVCYAPADKSLLERNRLKGGVMVTNLLKRSPLRAQGVEVGDIITQLDFGGQAYALDVNGEVMAPKFCSYQPLDAKALFNLAPIGGETTFHVCRPSLDLSALEAGGGGRVFEASVDRRMDLVVGAMRHIHTPHETWDYVPALGICVVDLTANLFGSAATAAFLRLNIEEREHNFAVVSFVHSQSTANTQGVAVGDRVLTVNDVPVSTAAEYRDALIGAAGKNRICRIGFEQGKAIFVTLRGKDLQDAVSEEHRLTDDNIYKTDKRVLAAWEGQR